MLAIRLRRQGAKRSPFYRIVVAERADKRDGRFVEVIGHYNPRVHPEQVRLDLDRFSYWQGQGAQPSGTVRTLLARHKEALVATSAARAAASTAAADDAAAETPSAEAPSDEVPSGGSVGRSGEAPAGDDAGAEAGREPS